MDSRWAAFMQSGLAILQLADDGQADTPEAKSWAQTELLTNSPPL